MSSSIDIVDVLKDLSKGLQGLLLMFKNTKHGDHVFLMRENPKKPTDMTDPSAAKDIYLDIKSEDVAKLRELITPLTTLVASLETSPEVTLGFLGE